MKFLSKKNSVYAKKAIEIGGKISRTVIHLTDKTSTIGKVGVALGIVEALAGGMGNLLDKYDDCNSHINLPHCIRAALLKVFLRYDILKKGDSKGMETEWILWDKESFIVWIQHDKEIYGPWYFNCSEEEAKNIIGKNLWECLGTNIEVKIQGYKNIDLIKDDLIESDCSDLADDVATRCKKFIDAGVNRGILFHGPPGTGKSYTMREIAKNLGGFSLRHTCCLWTDDVIPGIIEILCPRTLLMDDIDRVSTSGILSAIEKIRRKCNLILVSANYTENLDPALRRPGRFDESIHVEKLDEKAYGNLITDEIPYDDSKILRTLPIAYINEYRIVLKVLGQETASSRLVGLLNTYNEISESEKPKVEKEDDDDDDSPTETQNETIFRFITKHS